jgi:hypothetical protein
MTLWKTAIWYNLWPFCIVCGHLVYFLRFRMFGPRKIWQPWYVGTYKCISEANRDTIFVVNKRPVGYFEPS